MLDLNDYPLLVVFAVGLGVVLTLSEIGWQLGVRAEGRGSSNLTTLESAMLGLLALMIAFTFSMPVPDARLLLGRGAIIGLSVKTVEQAKAAPLELLDYVAIGGVYGTTSKENTKAPIGTHGLRAIVDTVRGRKANFPICAIAGINAANAGDVIAAGADGVAVISALSLAPDPAKAAQDLRTVVDGALARGGRL